MTTHLRLDEPLASPDRADFRLTAQEQDILALAGTGWNTSAIADALGLVPEAVQQLLASIIRRVGARSKLEAVMLVVRNGLMDLPTDTGRADADAGVYRASAVRPVTRLLRWDEDEQRSAREPLTLPATNGRTTRPHRDRPGVVDGAAT